MTPPSDMPPREMFDSIFGAEKDQAVRLHEEIQVLRRTIALSEALAGLGRTEHYKIFVAEIQKLRDVHLGKLLGSKTDREASILIGQGKALDDILSLMRNEESSRTRLAGALKAKEDLLAKINNPQAEYSP